MENYTLLQFMKKNFMGKRIKISGGYRQKTIVGTVKKIVWYKPSKWGSDADLCFEVKDENTLKLVRVWCYPTTKIEELLHLY